MNEANGDGAYNIILIVGDTVTVSRVFIDTFRNLECLANHQTDLQFDSGHFNFNRTFLSLLFGCIFGAGWLLGLNFTGFAPLDFCVGLIENRD